MNRAGDAFPEMSVGWGRLECTEVPCKVSSLKTLLLSGTENGICLITKIPALLSSYSLEEAWWELVDMELSSPGKSTCPLGLSESPNFPNAWTQVKQNTPQGSHHTVLHSIPSLKGGVL